MIPGFYAIHILTKDLRPGDSCRFPGGKKEMIMYVHILIFRKIILKMSKNK